MYIYFLNVVISDLFTNGSQVLQEIKQGENTALIFCLCRSLRASLHRLVHMLSSFLMQESSIIFTLVNLGQFSKVNISSRFQEGSTTAVHQPNSPLFKLLPFFHVSSVWRGSASCQSSLLWLVIASRSQIKHISSFFLLSCNL